MSALGLERDCPPTVCNGLTPLTSTTLHAVKRHYSSIGSVRLSVCLSEGGQFEEMCFQVISENRLYLTANRIVPYRKIKPHRMTLDLALSI